MVQNRTLALPVQKEKTSADKSHWPWTIKWGSRLSLDWIERELEIQPPELGLDFHGVRFQQSGEVLELFLNHG
jgi:hypothetical protein